MFSTKMRARGFQLLAVGLFIAIASRPANTQSSALDPTFGTNGMVTTNIASALAGLSFEMANDVAIQSGNNGRAPRHARAEAVALQPDGKTVRAGGAPGDFLDAERRFVFPRRACDWYDVGRWHH